MTSQIVNTRPKYHAFISYSANDKRWAKWLLRRLESYQIPEEFHGKTFSNGQTLETHLRPIFRDRDEMAPSSDLGDSLRKALVQSRNLIVICSPKSAESKWVNEEINLFRTHYDGSKILAFIVDGVPNSGEHNECFPPALNMINEPLAADARPAADGKERALVKIVSALLETDFDEIYKRHERKQKRARQLWTTILTLLAIAFASLSLYAFSQKRQAEVNEREAAEQRDLVRNEIVGSHLLLGDSAVERENVREGIYWYWRALDQALDTDPRKPGLRRLVSAWLEDLDQEVFLHDQDVRSVKFCNGDQHVMTASLDGTAVVWDLETGLPSSNVMRHKDGIWTASLSGDSQYIVTGSWDKTARVWHAKTGDPASPVLEHGSTPLFVEFLPDGKSLLTGSWDATVRLWDWEKGQKLRELSCNGMIEDLTVGPKGHWGIAVDGREDDSFQVWDKFGKKSIGKLQVGGEVDSLEFSPNNDRIFVGRESRPELWSFPEMELIQSLSHQYPLSEAAKFSPNGKRLATADHGVLKIWSSRTGELIASSDENLSRITSICFFPDSLVVFAGFADGSVTGWLTESSRLVFQSQPHHDAIISMDVSENGKLLLTGGLDSQAIVTELPKISEPLQEIEPCMTARWVEMNDQLQVITLFGRYQEWDLKTGKRLGKARDFDDTFNCALFGKSGSLLLTGSVEGAVSVWAASQQKILASTSLETVVESITWNQEHGLIAAGGINGRVGVWAFESNKLKLLWKKTAHSESVRSLAFSPDGKQLVTGGADEQVIAWEVDSGDKLDLLPTPSMTVSSIEFSSDQKHLIVCGANEGRVSREYGVACVMDASSQKLLTQPLLFESRVYAISISPDSSTLAVGLKNGETSIWDLATLRQLGKASQQQGEINALDFGTNMSLLSVSSAPIGRSEVARIKLPSPLLGDPDAIRLQVESHTGLTNERGFPVQSSFSSLLNSRKAAHGESDPSSGR